MILPTPLRRTLPLTGIAATVAAALVIAVLAGRGYLAGHLGRDLNQLSEAEIRLRMEQLVGLGEPGISVLAEALGSDQTTVARAAETALFGQIGRWKTLAADEASPKVAHLVHQLAMQSPQYGRRARVAAADLATQALDWRTDGSSIDRTQLITDCAVLLRAAGTDRSLIQPREWPRFFVNSQPPAPPPQPENDLPSFQSHGFAPTDSTAATSGPLVPQPGNDQPARVARNPLRRRATPLGSVPPPNETVPQSFPKTGKEVTPAASDKPPARLDPPLSRPVPWDPRRAIPTASPTARHMSADRPVQTIEFNGQDDLSLMRRLHALDPVEVRAARSELARRGFDTRYLRMAEDVTHPERDVRIRFAQALPAIRDVDVRPWLKTLADDEDAQVRLAAIAVIATLGTPSSRSWLRRLQLTEQNPRVQQHLRRILDQL